MNRVSEIIHEAVHCRTVQRGDFERILDLLVQTQAMTPLGFNWDIRRWEGKCWYASQADGNPDWHRNSQLWETSTGQLIGLVHPDGMGFPFIEIHPDYRHLEVEMIAWAENHLVEQTPGNSGRRLQFFVYEYDVYRQRLLEERGYHKMTYGGVIRHLRLGQQPLAKPTLAEGYMLHTPDPENGRDAQQIADLLNAAFNRTFHTALEYQQFTRRATCFHPELDLVAVAPDGRFATYVGIPYDEYNKRGMFEPVCTHPDHRQRGLAKSLMQAGLHRLKAWGAADVVVVTGDMIPANMLYASLGFSQIYKGTYWLRETI